MLYEYYPRHEDEATLLAKLKELGFDFTESNYSHANRADAVYLGKPILSHAKLDDDGKEVTPAVISELYCEDAISHAELDFEGIETNRPNNHVYSELYCANVISQTPLDFGDIETNRPNNPVSEWT